MRRFIICSFVLFLPWLMLAQGNGNLAGVNLVYNQSRLVDTRKAGQGYGFDLLYQSFARPNLSTIIQLGFLYDHFSSDLRESIFYPTTGLEELEYTREERFYTFSAGLSVGYSRLFGKFRPSLAAGTTALFIYKTYQYSYRIDPGTFVETEKKSRWLPAALSIPVCLGVQYLLDKKNVLQFCLTYEFLFWDKTAENYGYKDPLDLKLGYLRAVSFRL